MAAATWPTAVASASELIIQQVGPHRYHVRPRHPVCTGPGSIRELVTADLVTRRSFSPARTVYSVIRGQTLPPGPLLVYVCTPQSPCITQCTQSVYVWCSLNGNSHHCRLRGTNAHDQPSCVRVVVGNERIVHDAPHRRLVIPCTYTQTEVYGVGGGLRFARGALEGRGGSV